MRCGASGGNHVHCLERPQSAPPAALQPEYIAAVPDGIELLVLYRCMNFLLQLTTIGTVLWHDTCVGGH